MPLLLVSLSIGTLELSVLLYKIELLTVQVKTSCQLFQRDTSDISPLGTLNLSSLVTTTLGIFSIALGSYAPTGGAQPAGWTERDDTK